MGGCGGCGGWVWWVGGWVGGFTLLQRAQSERASSSSQVLGWMKRVLAVAFWVGGWVGGLNELGVGDKKVEEEEAVRMSYCGVGGWVGGWDGPTWGEEEFVLPPFLLLLPLPFPPSFLVLEVGEEGRMLFQPFRRGGAQGGT